MIVLFSLLSAIVLIGALWVVLLPNLFRAALSLGIVLVGVAALFIALGAEFLGFVQILVYVGAVLTLVVFAIMLTSRVNADAPPVAAAGRGPAAAVSAGLFVLLFSVTQALVPADAAGEPVTLTQLGRELITTYVLPFEVIGLLFVAAIIGAIAVSATTKSAAERHG